MLVHTTVCMKAAEIWLVISCGMKEPIVKEKNTTGVAIMLVVKTVIEEIGEFKLGILDISDQTFCT